MGEISKTKHGTPIKIIEYSGASNVIIECLDDHHYTAHSTYENFKCGKFKNPYDKSVFNIGYVGSGDFQCREKPSTMTTSYNKWCHMLERCYQESLRSKYSTYSSCYVCSEWHNYQNFAKWFLDNYYEISGERIELDKDILINGNKEYSPDNCLLVPQKINLIFTHRNRKNKLPTGIKISNNKYLASYNAKYIGTYNLLDEALQAYDMEKKKHIIEIAESYKYKIPDKVYQALLDIAL